MHLFEGTGLLVLTITLVVVISVSARVLALRAGLEAPRATRIAIATFVVAALWLGVTFTAANAGFYRAFASVPPRVPLTALSVVVGVLLLSRTGTFERLLDVIPLWWPIAIQVFRVPVELLLFALYERGEVPVQMTFEGRNFDVLVGLSAPIVAYAVYRGKLGPLGVRVWNVASLGLLLNIVVTAISSMPGPLHHEWGGVVPAIIAEAPFVWLPAFLVPLAALGHIVALRKVSVEVAKERGTLAA